MPAGTALEITLTPPAGTTGAGTVTLTTVAQSVVSNITSNKVATNPITYQLTATPAAGVVTSQSRTVTFTVAAFP